MILGRGKIENVRSFGRKQLIFDLINLQDEPLELLPIRNTGWVAEAGFMTVLEPYVYAWLADGSTMQLQVSSEASAPLDPPGTWPLVTAFVGDVDTGALMMISNGSFYRGDSGPSVLGPNSSVIAVAFPQWSWQHIKEPNEFSGARIFAYMYGLAYGWLNDTFVSLTTTSSHQETFSAGDVDEIMVQLGPNPRCVTLGDMIYVVSVHGTLHAIDPRNAFAALIVLSIPLAPSTPLAVANGLLWMFAGAEPYPLGFVDPTSPAPQFTPFALSSSLRFSNVTGLVGSQGALVLYNATTPQVTSKYLINLTTTIASPINLPALTNPTILTAIGEFVFMGNANQLYRLDLTTNTMIQWAQMRTWQQITLAVGYNGELFVFDSGTLYGVSRVSGEVRRIGAAGYWSGENLLIGLTALQNRTVWYDAGTVLNYLFESSTLSNSVTFDNGQPNVTTAEYIVSANVSVAVVADQPYFSYLRMRINALNISANNTSDEGTIAHRFHVGEAMDCIQLNNGNIAYVYASDEDTAESRDFKRAIISMIHTFTGAVNESQAVPEADSGGQYLAAYAYSDGGGVIMRAKHFTADSEAHSDNYGLFALPRTDQGVEEELSMDDSVLDDLEIVRTDNCLTRILEGKVILRKCNITSQFAEFAPALNVNSSFAFGMNVQNAGETSLSLASTTTPLTLWPPPTSARKQSVIHEASAKASYPDSSVWGAASARGCTVLPMSSESSAYRACAPLVNAMLQRIRVATTVESLYAELLNGLGVVHMQDLLHRHPGIVDLLLLADSPTSHALALECSADVEDTTAERLVLAFVRTRRPLPAWRHVLLSWSERGIHSGTLALGTLARRLQWQGLSAESLDITLFLHNRLSSLLQQRDELNAAAHMHALANVRHLTDWRWLGYCMGSRSHFLAHQAKRIAESLSTSSKRQLRVSGWQPGLPYQVVERFYSVEEGNAIHKLWDTAQPWFERVKNDTYGGDTVSATWTTTVSADAGIEVENGIIVNRSAYSRNRVELFASVFGFEVPIAEGILDFDLFSYDNVMMVRVFGETIFWKPLPCVLCFLSCKGPVGVLSSGYQQFVQFSRTFFAGPVPLEVGVSLAGGFSVPYQLQVCVMHNPAPEAIASISISAFASADAHAGVDLLVARGGVSASMNIFDGQIAGLGTLAVQTGPSWVLAGRVHLSVSSFTGSINAFFQHRGCGWLYLSWCRSYDYELLSWNGPSANFDVLTFTKPMLMLGLNTTYYDQQLELARHAASSPMTDLHDQALLTFAHQSYACKGEMAYKGVYDTTRLTPALTIQLIPGPGKPGGGETYAWRKDPAIEPDLQPAPDYNAGEGFDRGHLVPKRSFDPVDANLSFYMTNEAPQDPFFNRGVWNYLEGQIQRNCGGASGGQTWVVTGVSGSLPSKVKGVTAPHFFWKILCRMSDGGLKAWAHIADNTPFATATALQDPAVIFLEAPGGYRSWNDIRLAFGVPGIPSECDGAEIPTFEEIYGC